MTTDEQITISRDDYDKYKKAYDSQHVKYGDMTDDQIEAIIKRRVNIEQNKWLTEYYNAQIDAGMEVTRAQLEQLALDREDIVNRTLDLKKRAREAYYEPPEEE